MRVPSRIKRPPSWKGRALISQRRCEIDGIKFPSMLEGGTYLKLKEREAKGEIKIRKVQSAIFLSRARVKYIADFECESLIDGEVFFAEAKGKPNQRWPVIKQLYRIYGPNRLEIWTGDWTKPVLSEIIVPREINNAN